MTRLVLVAVLLAPACVTPAFPQPDEQPDATPPDAPDNCELRVDAVGDGHHNPGTACLDCHNGQEQGAPVFTLAGTVYKDAGGTIPKTHATVIVLDGDGQVVKLPTATNGNFYTQAALAPPYFTAVSECPDTAPMEQNFSDGDCNSCHSGVASPGRIVFAD